MHSVCANSAELSTMFGKMFDAGMEKSIPEWDALMGGAIGYILLRHFIRSIGEKLVHLA